MNQRKIHDASVAMAQALLDLMQPHLPYEERLKAIGDFYCVCKAGSRPTKSSSTGCSIA